jgi:diacylglycerol kinase (ATP)
MRNQPKYSLFKNTSYAIDGLKDLLTTETSFRLEVIFIIFLSLVLIFIDVTFIEKIIMFLSLVLILIVEALNGAIERVVDLVTLEHHEMAKKAKDAGSTAVFISISFAVIVWGSVLIKNFF